jgi:hypothetical protein
MVPMIPTKKAKYEYLVLYFHILESEIGLWEALFEHDKSVLSKKIYDTIAIEMDILQESSSQRRKRIKYKNPLRRLFLLPLPEYDVIIHFIKANIRRPAFKDHLKKLILQCGQTHALSVSDSPIFPESANQAQIGKESGPRSPRELFHDANKLIQTMLVELMKPEAARIFDWDRIRPDAYPAEVKSSRLFARLEEYWNNKIKNPDRGSECITDT